MRLLIVISWLYASILSAHPKTSAYGVSYEAVGQMLLVDLQHEESKQQEKKKIIRKGKANIAKKDPTQKLDAYTQLRAVFTTMEVLGSYRKVEGLTASIVPLLHDLKFFIRDSPTGRSTFSAIDRSQTPFGKIVLATMLANPEINLQKLHKRQQFIAGLVKDKKLLQTLQLLLSTIKNDLGVLLATWHQDPELAALINENLKPSKSSLKNKLSNIYHEGLIASGSMFGVGSAISSTHWFLKNLADTTENLADKEATRAHSEGKTWRKKFKSRTGGFFKELATLGKANPGKAALLMAVLGGSALSTVYSGTHKAQKNRRRLSRYLHARTIAAAKLFQLVKELNQHTMGLPHADRVLKKYNLIAHLTTTAQQGVKNIDKIVKEFEAHPERYQGKKGKYWGVDSAAIISLHETLLEAQDDFAELFEAIGEVDALVAMADWVAKPYEHVRTSLAQFSDKLGPKVEFKAFWHPLIDPTKVVSNNISIEQKHRGMILTGSNTGGKSTLIKSILISILTSHGSGIAFAKHASLTPMSLMASSMNISDETSKGISLFQAEANRARLLQTMARRLKKTKTYGIMAIDELFRGTAPERAAKNASKVANNLFDNEYLATIFSTHYHEVTSLDKTKPYVANWHVDAYTTPEGKIVRPHKLEPGMTKSNIADAILKEQEDLEDSSEDTDDTDD